MNERIKELAKQAVFESYKAGCIDQKEILLEKFAELIVRECVNKIESKRSSGENTDSWTITRDLAFHEMKRDIAKHFGVEE
jgi:hypothetical protein